jgi:hypothetical protein
LLSQSLYLFWNHLERNTYEESFGKKDSSNQMRALHYLGVVSGVARRSRSMSRTRRSRGRLRSTSSMDSQEDSWKSFSTKMQEMLGPEHTETLGFLDDVSEAIANYWKGYKETY